MEASSSAIFDQMPEFDHVVPFTLLIWAVLIGIFLSLVVNMGPAFITLIQTSLHRGFRSAAWFALGVILNDALIIALCILTSVQVVVSEKSKIDPALFSIGAGVILVLFGIFTFRKKVKTPEEILAEHPERVAKDVDVKPAWYVFFGKGFALNILNPFVWIFWFSSVAIVAGNMPGESGDKKLITLLFFAIILGTTLTMEFLKAWGAAKLKRFLNPKRTTIMNRAAGIMLVVCGLYFIVLKGIVELI